MEIQTIIKNLRKVVNVPERWLHPVGIKRNRFLVDKGNKVAEMSCEHSSMHFFKVNLKGSGKNTQFFIKRG